MHVDKWLLSAAWYYQNTFLILLLLSSNCKKCYLVSYKGLLHCCVSSFCLCSALLSLYEISLCHTALLGVADGAQPQSSTLLLRKQGKHTGSETTWVDFKEKHLTQKNPKNLEYFQSFLYYTERYLSKIMQPPQFLCTAANWWAKPEMGIFSLTLSLDFRCPVFVLHNHRFVTK